MKIIKALQYQETLEKLRYNYRETCDFGSFSKYIGEKELGAVNKLLKQLEKDIEKTEAKTNLTEFELKEAVKKLKRMLR
jgi:hypothetical protein